MPRSNLNRPPETVDTSELPIILQEGGPTAGHTYEAIEEGECGHCGYDRIKVKQEYGEVSKTCLLCGAGGISGDFSLPDSDTDRLRQTRRYAESEDSPVTKHGEFGARSRYTHGAEVFSIYRDEPQSFRIYEHGRNGTNTTETRLQSDLLKGLLTVLEDDCSFVTEFVESELDGKCITNSKNAPPNREAITAHSLRNDKMTTRFWIKLHHKGFHDIPIHFNPDDPRITV